MTIMAGLVGVVVSQIACILKESYNHNLYLCDLVYDCLADKW
jgi:hypothetical protein